MALQICSVVAVMTLSLISDRLPVERGGGERPRVSPTGTSYVRSVIFHLWALSVLRRFKALLPAEPESCCVRVDFLLGWEEEPQVHQNFNAMKVQQKETSYGPGRRPVKGPRQAVCSQAALFEKSATGATSEKHKQKRCQDWWEKKRKKQVQQSKKRASFNIAQVNVCGIRYKKVEIEKILSDNKVHVALLQETLHSADADLHITGYTSYACDCNNCQGIITYIRNDIQGTTEHVQTPQSTDCQRATVWDAEGNKYTVYNVYNPPPETLSIPELQATNFAKTIIAGDFNGHSPLWGYKDYNNTGKYIEELCNSTNLSVLQNDKSPPTLLHRAHGTLSRPDLTIISSDLGSHCSIQVLGDIGSDHKPILTTITTNQRNHYKRKARWNFKRTDWDKYKSTSEQLLGHLNSSGSIDTLNDQVTSAILQAASLCIPRGFRTTYRPFWNEDIQTAVTARQEAKRVLEDSPSQEHKILYNKAAAKVKRVVKLAKKEKWTTTCEALDLRRSGAKAWSLLSNLSGERRRSNPQPMTEQTTTIASDGKKAELFNKHFSSVNKASKPTEMDKERLRDLKMQEKSPSASISLFEGAFTPGELRRALRKLRPKKAPGPDKLHNEMLTKLGPKGKACVLRLINESWRTGQLPVAWKNAYITPILKKGKDPKDPKSYRPISLTSCLGKLAERMINRRLYWWLESTKTLCPEQAGFRAGCQTEDQLFRLTQRIQDGFQKGQHTTAVFVDLQQAYDRVWRKGLLMKMKKIGIHGKLYTWIKFFLTDRTIQTKINDALSSKKVLEEGLPQGSALSCTLFLIFINDLVEKLETEKALYADDLALWHTHKYVRQSQRRLNEDLEKLDRFCSDWKLKVNNGKTVYTIFTNSHKVCKQKLKLKMADHELQKEENPEYLGVTMDRQLNFNKHMENLKKKTTKRLSLVKRVASTTWGSDKDTLRGLYLGYVRSVMEYCQAIQISCSKTTLDSLDRVQNQALRFVSGGMRSTPSAACEIHTNIQPLGLRREMAALKTFERSKRMDKDHPNRKLVDDWQPYQRLKQKSILHCVAELQEKCHLPEERMESKKILKHLPPNASFRQPTIELQLKDKTINKKSDPVSLKLAAAETIDSYPDSWIHIYTDGSAFKATINAGYGICIRYPDGSCDELSGACGATCSNYEAEVAAVDTALYHLSTVFTAFPSKVQDVVIFSDSLSALQALENEKHESADIMDTVQTIDHLLSSFDIRLVLQWIPGHSETPGNDRADKLAKQGSTQPQPDKPTTYETAKQIIQNNYREEWMNGWACGKTGRVVYQHMNKPNLKDNINDLQRRDQVIIFRLRCQHIPLNMHLNRIQPQHPPACQLCDHPYETVKHFLFDCQKLADIRAQLLPPSPDISNTLYGTTPQLKDTCTYYNMALGRRAKAQALLDH